MARKCLGWTGIQMTPTYSCQARGTTLLSCGVSQTVHACAPLSDTPTASILSSGALFSSPIVVNCTVRACSVIFSSINLPCILLLRVLRNSSCDAPSTAISSSCTAHHRACLLLDYHVSTAPAAVFCCILVNCVTCCYAVVNVQLPALHHLGLFCIPELDPCE